MLLIEITINAFVLAGLVLASIGLGFMFRSNQVTIHKKKVVELEKEMLLNHAEILELQQRNNALELKVRTLSIPVIPMNTKEELEKKVADKRKNS